MKIRINEKYRRQWRTGLYAANPEQARLLVEELDERQEEAIKLADALQAQIRHSYSVISDLEREKIGNGWAVAVAWAIQDPGYTGFKEDMWWQIGKALAALPPPLGE